MPKNLTYTECKPYLDEFISHLSRELGSNLVAVALFGSVARAEGSSHSEIDLLIVHEKTECDLMAKLIEIENAMEANEEFQKLMHAGYQPAIFPVFLAVDELKPTPWIFLDIQDHGLILFDRNGVLKDKFESV